MNPYPVIEAEVLFRPSSPELRFLPEGPQNYGPGLLSWVAIQHGPDATTGSLNVLDIAQQTNNTYPMPGRPGFAFPTTREQTFLLGLEHQLVLFHRDTGKVEPIGEPVEQDVAGTIINDAEFFEEGVVFGAKDLKFAEAKAGLYLFRARDQRIFQLRNDQVCSNGKVITANPDGSYRVLDIDTPKKTVVEYRLDVSEGKLEFVRTALDLTHLEPFPDGMVASPDGRAVIIAFYNPQDASFGEARQFDLVTGDTMSIWTTLDAPQVTCPQLVPLDGSIKIVLTTAVEHMSAERQQKHRNSGCLFIADTMFSTDLKPRRIQL